MLFKQKILLIHKSQKIKETIVTYLRELDYAVIVASTMEDVYNLAKTTKPDLILWGAALSSDGKKLLRRIKRATFSKNVPVLAMISDIDLYERIELEKNGIHDVMSSDPNLSEIRLRIKLHLEYKDVSLTQKQEIRRLRNVSEILYNFSIVNNVQDVSDLFSDFLSQDYNFDFVLLLIYNPRTGGYEYKKTLFPKTIKFESIASILLNSLFGRIYIFPVKHQKWKKLPTKRFSPFLLQLELRQRSIIKFPLRRKQKQWE